MENITTKIDSNTIEIVVTPPTPEPTKTQYERGFIENQIIAIQKQKDDFDALRDTEILECKNILAKMDTLGIVVKVEPVEVVPVNAQPLPVDKIIPA